MPLLSHSVLQLVLAFTSASILRRLTARRLFLNWLTSHKFFIYWIPSNEDLRKIRDKTGEAKQSQQHSSKRGKGGRARARGHQKDAPPSVFKIPAAALVDLQLKRSIPTANDIDVIPYSAELEWIVDLSLMSIVSYSITQIHFYLDPKTDDYNFSLLWGVLVLIYCSKILVQLTGFGERSICIVSGCCFLLLAMMILVVDEKILEFGLDDAYKSFNNSANAFVRNHNLTGRDTKSTRPISFVMVKLSIAVLSAITGLIFTFPGLRYGQLNKLLLETHDITTIGRISYSFNYLSSLFVICLWIKPISRTPLTQQDIFPIAEETFETLRIYFIVLTNLLRFFMTPHYIAAFLASANLRVTRLRQRGGQVTNRDVQLAVSSVLNYVNVVAMQYILPLLLCLFTAILLTTMGELNWLPPFFYIYSNREPFSNFTDDYMHNGNISSLTKVNGTESFDSDGFTQSKLFPSLAMIKFEDVKRISTPQVYKALLGYATWWLHLSWFCNTSMGMMYHTYFLH